MNFQMHDTDAADFTGYSLLRKIHCQDEHGEDGHVDDLLKSGEEAIGELSRGPRGSRKYSKYIHAVHVRDL